MTKFNPPEHITQVLRQLNECGHEAYLVGGCVRDAVIGRTVNDWDIATSATPVDVGLIFPKTVLTGEKFGTVTVVLPECPVEVTTFRSESEYQDGRRPKNVEFVSSLEEDLSRRDFTMNAMAVSLTGELIDIFHGIEDIENRLVRCVGGPNKRFAEDALRMFRVFRFSAQLDFAIEKETMSAIYANVGRAQLISSERIRAELEKTLVSRKPEVAGEILKVGLLAHFTGAPGYTPEGLERLELLPAEPEIRWCAFCSVLLRGGLIKSESEFLQNMRLDGKTVRTCARALSITDFPDDRAGLKRLFSVYGIDAVRCAAAVYQLHNNVDVLARCSEVIRSGECFSLNKLAVTGNDLISLGFKPGYELGKRLDAILSHVLDYPEDNNREHLLSLAKQ